MATTPPQDSQRREWPEAKKAKFKQLFLKMIQDDQYVLGQTGNNEIRTLLKTAQQAGLVEPEFAQKYDQYRVARFKQVSKAPLVDPTTGQPAMKTVPQPRQFDPATKTYRSPGMKTVPMTGADLTVSGNYFPKADPERVAQARAKILKLQADETATEVQRYQAIQDLLEPKDLGGQIAIAKEAYLGTAKGLYDAGKITAAGIPGIGEFVKPPSPEELASKYLVKDINQMQPGTILQELQQAGRITGLNTGRQIGGIVGGVTGSQLGAAGGAALGLAAGPAGAILGSLAVAAGSYGGAIALGATQDALMRRAYGSKWKDVESIFNQSNYEVPGASFVADLAATVLQGAPTLASGIGTKKTIGLVNAALRGETVGLSGTAAQLGLGARKIQQAADAADTLRMVGQPNKFDRLVSNFLQRTGAAPKEVADSFKIFEPKAATKLGRLGELGTFVNRTPGATEFVYDAIGEQGINLAMSAYRFGDKLNRYRNDTTGTVEQPSIAEALGELAFGSLFIGNNRFTDGISRIGSTIGRGIVRGAERIPGIGGVVTAAKDRYDEARKGIYKSFLRDETIATIRGERPEAQADLGVRYRLGQMGQAPNIQLTADERLISLGGNRAIVFNPKVGNTREVNFYDVAPGIDDADAVAAGERMAGAIAALPTKPTDSLIGRRFGLGGQQGREAILREGVSQQAVSGVVSINGEGFVVVREVPDVVDGGKAKRGIEPVYSILRMEDLDLPGNVTRASQMMQSAGLTPSKSKLPTNDFTALVAVEQQSLQELDKQLKGDAKGEKTGAILKEFPSKIQLDRGVEVRGRVVGIADNNDVIVQVMSPREVFLRIDPVNVTNATEPLKPMSLNSLFDEIDLSGASMPRWDTAFDAVTSNSALHTMPGDNVPILLTGEQLSRIPDLRKAYELASREVLSSISDPALFDKESARINAALSKNLVRKEDPQAENDYETGSTIEVYNPDGELETGVVMGNSNFGPVVYLESQGGKPVIVQEPQIVRGKATVKPKKEEPKPEGKKRTATEIIREELKPKKEKASGKKPVAAITAIEDELPISEPEVETPTAETPKAEKTRVRSERRTGGIRPPTERQAAVILGATGETVVQFKGKSYNVIQTQPDGRNVNVVQRLIGRAVNDVETLTDEDLDILEALKMPRPLENMPWYVNAHQQISYLNEPELKALIDTVDLTDKTRTFSSRERSLLIDGAFASLSDGDLVIDFAGVNRIKTAPLGMMVAGLAQSTGSDVSEEQALNGEYAIESIMRSLRFGNQEIVVDLSKTVFDKDTFQKELERVLTSIESSVSKPPSTRRQLELRQLIEGLFANEDFASLGASGGVTSLPKELQRQVQFKQSVFDGLADKAVQMFSAPDTANEIIDQLINNDVLLEQDGEIIRTQFEAGLFDTDRQAVDALQQMYEMRLIAEDIADQQGLDDLPRIATQSALNDANPTGIQTLKIGPINFKEYLNQTVSDTAAQIKRHAEVLQGYAYLPSVDDPSKTVWRRIEESDVPVAIDDRPEYNRLARVYANRVIADAASGVKKTVATIPEFRGAAPQVDVVAQPAAPVDVDAIPGFVFPAGVKAPRVKSGRPMSKWGRDESLMFAQAVRYFSAVSSLSPETLPEAHRESINESLKSYLNGLIGLKLIDETSFSKWWAASYRPLKKGNTLQTANPVTASNFLLEWFARDENVSEFSKYIQNPDIEINSDYVSQNSMTYVSDNGTFTMVFGGFDLLVPFAQVSGKIELGKDRRGKPAYIVMLDRPETEDQEAKKNNPVAVFRLEDIANALIEDEPSIEKLNSIPKMEIYNALTSNVSAQYLGSFVRGSFDDPDMERYLVALPESKQEEIYAMQWRRMNPNAPVPNEIMSILDRLGVEEAQRLKKETIELAKEKRAATRERTKDRNKRMGIAAAGKKPTEEGEVAQPSEAASSEKTSAAEKQPSLGTIADREAKIITDADGKPILNSKGQIVIGKIVKKQWRKFPRNIQQWLDAGFTEDEVGDIVAKYNNIVMRSELMDTVKRIQSGQILINGKWREVDQRWLPFGTQPLDRSSAATWAAENNPQRFWSSIPAATLREAKRLKDLFTTRTNLLRTYEFAKKERERIGLSAEYVATESSFVQFEQVPVPMSERPAKPSYDAINRELSRQGKKKDGAEVKEAFAEAMREWDATAFRTRVVAREGARGEGRFRQRIPEEAREPLAGVPFRFSSRNPNASRPYLDGKAFTWTTAEEAINELGLQIDGSRIDSKPGSMLAAVLASMESEIASSIESANAATETYARVIANKDSSVEPISYVQEIKGINPEDVPGYVAPDVADGPDVSKEQRINAKESAIALANMFDTFIHAAQSRRIDILVDSIKRGNLLPGARGANIPLRFRPTQTRGRVVEMSFTTAVESDIRPLSEEFIRIWEEQTGEQLDQSSLQTLFNSVELEGEDNTLAGNLRSRIESVLERIAEQETTSFYRNRMPVFANFGSVIPTIRGLNGAYLNIYDPSGKTSTKVLMAFGSADFSTFVEELSHAFIEGLPSALKEELVKTAGYETRTPTITNPSIVPMEFQEDFANSLMATLASKNFGGSTGGRKARPEFQQILEPVGNVLEGTYISLIDKSLTIGNTPLVQRTGENFSLMWQVPVTTARGKSPSQRVSLWQGAPVILWDGRMGKLQDHLGTKATARTKASILFENETTGARFTETINASEIKAIGAYTNGLNPEVMKVLHSWVGERRSELGIGLSTVASREGRLYRDNQGQVDFASRNVGRVIRNLQSDSGVQQLLSNFGFGPRSGITWNVMQSFLSPDLVERVWNRDTMERLGREYVSNPAAALESNKDVAAVVDAYIAAKVYVAAQRAASTDGDLQAAALIQSMDKSGNTQFNRARVAYHRIHHYARASQLLVADAIKQASQNKEAIAVSIPGYQIIVRTNPLTGKFSLSSTGEITVFVAKIPEPVKGRKRKSADVRTDEFKVNLKTGQVAYQTSHFSDNTKRSLPIVQIDFMNPVLPAGAASVGGRKISMPETTWTQANQTVNDSLTAAGLRTRSWIPKIPHPLYVATKAVLDGSGGIAPDAEWNLFPPMAPSPVIVTNFLGQTTNDPMDDGVPMPSVESIVPIPLEMQETTSEVVVDAVSPSPVATNSPDKAVYTLAGVEFIGDSANAYDQIFSSALEDVREGRMDQANKKMAYLSSIASTELSTAFDSLDAKIKVTLGPAVSFGDARPILAGSIEVADAAVSDILSRAAYIGEQTAQPNVYVTGIAPAQARVGTINRKDGSMIVPSYFADLPDPINEETLREFAELYPQIGEGGRITHDGKRLELFMVPDGEFNRKEAVVYGEAVRNAIQEFFGGKATISQGKLKLWNLGAAAFGGRGTFLEYGTVRGVVSTEAYAEQIQVNDGTSAKTRRRLRSELARILSVMGSKSILLPEEAQFLREKMPAQVAMDIAMAFDQIPMDADDPNVTKAYKTLQKELTQQFRALGLSVEFMPREGDVVVDPYGGRPEVAVADIVNNRRIFIRQSEFGNSNLKKHKLLMQSSGFKTESGTDLAYNDLLRAIHDALSYASLDTTFGRNSEDMAYIAHAMLTQDEWAMWALAMETRIQNIWYKHNGLTLNPTGTPRTDVEGALAMPQKDGLITFDALYTGVKAIDDRLRKFAAQRKKDGDSYQGTVEQGFRDKTILNGEGRPVVPKNNPVDIPDNEFIYEEDPALGDGEFEIDIASAVMRVPQGALPTTSPSQKISNSAPKPAAPAKQKQRPSRQQPAPAPQFSPMPAPPAAPRVPAPAVRPAGAPVPTVLQRPQVPAPAVAARRPQTQVQYHMNNAERVALVFNTLLRQGATGDASPILMQNWSLANLMVNPHMLGRQLRLATQVFLSPNIGLQRKDGTFVNEKGMFGRKLSIEVLNNEVRSLQGYDIMEEAGMFLGAYKIDNALAELQKTNPNATYMDVDELGYDMDIRDDTGVLKHWPGQGQSERFYTLSRDAVKMRFASNFIQHLVDLGYNPTPIYQKDSQGNYILDKNGNPILNRTPFTMAMRDLANLMNLMSGDVRVSIDDLTDERVMRLGKFLLFSPRWATSRLLLSSMGRGMMRHAFEQAGPQGEAFIQRVFEANGVSDDQLKKRDPRVSALHARLLWKSWLLWMSIVAAIYGSNALNPHTLGVKVDKFGTRLRIGDYTFRMPGAMMLQLEMLAAVSDAYGEWNKRTGAEGETGFWESAARAINSTLISRSSPLLRFIWEAASGRDAFGKPSFVTDEAAQVFMDQVLYPELERMDVPGSKERAMFLASLLDVPLSKFVMWWPMRDTLETFRKQRQLSIDRSDALISALAIGAWSGIGGRSTYSPDELKWEMQANRNFVRDTSAFNPMTYITGGRAVPAPVDSYEPTLESIDAPMYDYRIGSPDLTKEGQVEEGLPIPDQSLELEMSR